MARGINKVIAIGNLGRDPETRYTQGGDPVTSFSIACSESWKKDGQTQERTEWIRCVTFGKLASICADYLKKGSKVYIEGKLHTSQYEKDGQKHYSTDVQVREMSMLDGRGGSQSDTGPSQEFGGGGGFEDDVPFMRMPNW